ncbi:hypothetical protein ACFCZ3_20065 [Cellulosimicrobium cellulans]|uniref:hypothetical protein n=1 Tax=Cellulosimicrobium cellulans TaxID=1710 RepID=UPI0035D86382
MTGTTRERAVAALASHQWRAPDEPGARYSASTEHRYDYACALCRPDLDDGYGRIVDVVLAAALTDVDAIAARIEPSIVEPKRSILLAAWDAAGLDSERFMAEREAGARRRAADVVALLTGDPNATCDPAPESNGTARSLAIGDEHLSAARVRFWRCPVREHRDRMAVTVVWRDGTPYCTAPGCEHAEPATDARPLGHGFRPVAGHPDDDECTHRADGTDATYCGEPRAAHDDELGTGGDS